MVITECRVCGNRTLLPVLDLGRQSLTGIFPSSREEVVPAAPLEVVRCGPDGCGLVQLRHTADLSLMYGAHYGYRSGIRPFMVNHLHHKVAELTARVDVGPGDLVLDIGSNDSTLLRGYRPDGPTLVGVDPTGEKWRSYYPDHVDLIPEFFTREVFAEHHGSRQARIVTSIAMFYDLPDPLRFMGDIRDVLAPDGVWMMEMSYLPKLLEVTAYDTICHEHLEYYSLRQIEWMAERVELEVVKAEITDVYGGSLCVTLARRGSPHRPDEAGLARLRAQELGLGLDTSAPYDAFVRRVEEHRDRTREFLDLSRKEGRLTVGYGASTKGNVLLQYCAVTEDDLMCIGEVSPEKAGHFTPGTGIPIVSEEAAKAARPDQLFVLPWVYRDGYLERERDYLTAGGRLVFPLPELEVV
ncbi:class I SAM-dependent methyltransferase [Streptomyces violaceusniger]|uniref:Methyltransferase n=1 Tax=Streptomyces violaceusniger TaxID=68280 RepID=A0A4D4KUV2_STRVO|nr:methyltransferase [Streptomyces violaceusniger]